MTRMFDARPEDIAEGAAIGSGGKIDCQESGVTLRERDEVVVYFQRHKSGDVWSRGGVYHPDHWAKEDHMPCFGYDEFFARGRLAVVSGSQTHDARLTVADVDVIQAYGPTDGDYSYLPEEAQVDTE